MARPLGEPAFRQLWLGQAISSLGDPLQTVALAWLVLDRTGSAVALSAALLGMTIPRGALTLFGGALVDRIGPRQVVLWSDTVRAVAVAGLAGLAVAPSFALWPWALAAVLAVYGAASGLFAPAIQSITPRLVPAAELQSAVAVREATAQMAVLVGAPLAGAVVAVVGPAAAFGLNAASFGAAAVATRSVPAAQGPRETADHDCQVRSGVATTSAMSGGLRGLLAEAFAGLGVVRQHTWLTALVLIEAVCNLVGSGPLTIGLPLLARGPLAAGSAGYGLLLAAAGAGHVVGMLLLAGRRPMARRGQRYCLLIVAQAPLFAGLAVAPFWLALALLGLSGLLNGVVLVMFLNMLQTRVEAAVLGRVMGVVSLAFYGLGPVSQAAAGPLVAMVGPGALFGMAGGVFLLAGLGGLLVPDLVGLE